jgi:hypothetical protein
LRETNLKTPRTTHHVPRATQGALVILAAFVAIAVVYSSVTPLFEGPDEIWHFAFANHLANGGGLPVFAAAEPATFLRNGAHPPVYYALLAAIIAPIDRADFPAEFHFNLANPLITPGATGTPPNLLIHTAREDWPWRNTTLAAHLARFVSIALNALALWGVWQVARRVLRDERLAVLALAWAASVPQFVYGAATINNDALAAAATTWLIYALVRWLDDPSFRSAALSGTLLGLALLSKIGLIVLLPVPLVAIALHTLRHPHHAGRRRLAQALIMYGAAFAIAGWWYLRNGSLYGDLLAWREWQALTGAGRVPPTLGDFVGDLLGLFGTFWIDFSLRVDRVWWPAFGAISLAALSGLVRRAIKHDWPLEGDKLLIALSVWALLLASAARYSLNIYNIHGRLLYPALAAVGCALALGVSAWSGPRGRAIAIGLAAIPLAFTLVSPFAIIQPAYARPIVSALPDGVKAISAQFGEVELIGYRAAADRIKSGERLAVETYWRRTRLAEPADQTALHARVTVPMIELGAWLGRGEVALGNDVYPSWAWPLNEMVVTRQSVVVEADASAVGEVQLGVRGETAALIPSARGATIGLGRVIVQQPQACGAMAPAAITFGGAIKLSGYRVEQSTGRGVPARVVLCWQSLKPVAIDYTVFVHVTDARGEAFTSDAPPRGGTYPTSAWQPGDEIEDGHPLAAVIDLIVKRVAVGLYRLDTGERLMIDGGAETEVPLIK